MTAYKPVSTQEIDRYRKRLDDLFGLVKSLDYDSELKPHLARYLCVLVSGFLEVSMKEIYLKYSRARAGSRVVNFVGSELGYFQDPDMGKILQLTGRFSQEWAKDLEAITEGEIKEQVNSVVHTRNKIAHGENVGISYVQIQEYYRTVVRLVDLIDSKCNR